MGYHLGLVHRYYRLHGFESITTSVYAQLSQGAEMLYLSAYAIGRESAAKLVHLSFLIATAGGSPMSCQEISGRPRRSVRYGRLLHVPGRHPRRDLRLQRLRSRLHRARVLLRAAAVVARRQPAMAASARHSDRVLVRDQVHRRDRDRCRLRSGAPPPVQGRLCEIDGEATRMDRSAGGRCRIAVAGQETRSSRAIPSRRSSTAGSPIHSSASSGKRHTSSRCALIAKGHSTAGNRLLAAPFDLVIGERYAGSLGWMILLLPIALIAWKKPLTRALLAAAVIGATPWLANAGARFLIPSLPFALLAIGIALDETAPPVALWGRGAPAWPVSASRRGPPSARAGTTPICGASKACHGGRR